MYRVGQMQRAPMGRHETLAFEIDGLSCAGCVRRAETALAAVGGVDRAEVNLATRTGRVEVDPDTPGVARNLAGALGAAGYPAVAHSHALVIEGMTCASCQSRVETALGQVPGVLSAQVNYATGAARVEALFADPAPLIAAVAETGYAARATTATSAYAPGTRTPARPRWIATRSRSPISAAAP